MRVLVFTSRVLRGYCAAAFFKLFVFFVDFLSKQGWDKTYCLQFLGEGNSEYDEIHFFGDKTFKVIAPAAQPPPSRERYVVDYQKS